MLLPLPLLLFDTHAGGNLTLNPTSVSVLRDFMSTNKMGIGGVRKPGGWRRRLEECVFILGYGCDEPRGVGEERARFYLQPWQFEWKANRDVLTRTNGTFLGCCLSVSRVLFTWMRQTIFFCHCLLTYCSSSFISATRSHAFCSVFVLLFFSPHKNLNYSLLAPYYHISDKRGK